MEVPVAGLPLPSTPQVGYLYLLQPAVLGDRDKGVPRRVVVVRGVDEFEEVAVVARTTDTKVAGVFHPADRHKKCTEKGVFGIAAEYQHRVPEDLLLDPSSAEYLGRLGHHYLDPLLEQLGLT